MAAALGMAWRHLWWCIPVARGWAKSREAIKKSEMARVVTDSDQTTERKSYGRALKRCLRVTELDVEDRCSGLNKHAG
jgi:hypothetical protein